MRPSNVTVFIRRFIKGDEDNQKSYEKRVKLTNSGFWEETQSLDSQDGSNIPSFERYLRIPKHLKISEKDVISMKYKDTKDKSLDNKLFRILTENDKTQFYKVFTLESWDFIE